MIIAQGVTPQGVRYIVHDDCIAPKGSAEEARVIAEQRRAAYEILRRAAKREAREHGSDRR